MYGKKDSWKGWVGACVWLVAGNICHHIRTCTNYAFIATIHYPTKTPGHQYHGLISHSVTLSWHWANHSCPILSQPLLPYPHNSECLASNFKLLLWIDQGLNVWIWIPYLPKLKTDAQLIRSSRLVCVCENVCLEWRCWGFYVLETSMVRTVPTSDSTHSRQLYSATPLEDHTAGTMTRYHTQLHYPDTELTRSCHILVKPNASR